MEVGRDGELGARAVRVRGVPRFSSDGFGIRRAPLVGQVPSRSTWLKLLAANAVVPALMGRGEAVCVMQTLLGDAVSL